MLSLCISGKTYTLDNFKDHVIFMEYFATWCLHCKNMLPIVHELYNKYNSSIIFISVSQENIFANM
ncbi:MAG: TlpA family protein disulfide reductase [Thermoprotei archaeon]|jgi:thiol-disulfide isomerase/thioredoxin